MKHARILLNNALERGPLHAVEDEARCAWTMAARALRAVRWLPPLAPVPRARTVFALGLNYADHAKELAFKPPEEPLAFLKGEAADRPPRAHRAPGRRKHALRVRAGGGDRPHGAPREARRRLRLRAGYTVANDYAIRDYLENWYRPNLRVKNRDTCTPLGPWLVDAADMPDPPHEPGLRPRSTARSPSGQHRDMVFDVPR
jgi:5-oxopent-3-ene-1,2,5-tricarboxylate decarboxylase/2-hydroxyhepta-2,4-diene-1,7-dioate isomerase